MTASHGVLSGSQVLAVSTNTYNAALLLIHRQRVLLLCEDGHVGALDARYALPRCGEKEPMSRQTLGKIIFKRYGVDTVGEVLAVSGLIPNNELLIVCHLTDVGSAHVTTCHGDKHLWTDVDGVPYCALAHELDRTVLHSQSVLFRNLTRAPGSDAAKVLIQAVQVAVARL